MTTLSPPFSTLSAQLSISKPINEFSLTTLLKSASTLSDSLPTVQQLHAQIIKSGLAPDPGIRTSLITLYSSCNLLNHSLNVFYEVLPFENCDSPTWNSMLSACICNRDYDEFIQLLSFMVKHVAFTIATCVVVIRACADMNRVEIGRIMHAKMIKEGFLTEVRVSNTLITFYSQFGLLRYARNVFDDMGETNVVSWNAMISGYEQNDEFEEALDLFREIRIRPNRITYLSLMSAISSIKILKLGKEIHARVIREGVDFETSVGNSLITMYGKCGNVDNARKVFNKMHERDVISWNSMLACYAKNECLEKCHELFREMQFSGMETDDHTITIIVSSSYRSGREIHGYLAKSLVPNVPVMNSIISMYAKNDKLEYAERIFNEMKIRDLYTWNAMMDGYSTRGCYNKALKLFIKLLERDVRFNHLTLSILLTICAKLASLEPGKQFHALTIKHKNHISISNALISMYSKCGDVFEALKAFDRIPRKDVVSYTSMITGYAHQGMAYESFNLFDKMIKEGVEPNDITFLSILTACSHSGLVEDGEYYFEMMKKEYCMEPNIEHYACMVDLHGRARDFEKAKKIVVENGSRLTLWKVLLGACYMHRNLDLGKISADKILELDPMDENAYVVLSNMYAMVGLWKEAIDMRGRMKDKGLSKEVGFSWVEDCGKMHVFAAGDVRHLYRKEIYEKAREVDEKCRRIGYVPMTKCVVHDVEEEKKEEILRSHSERLALCFGLLRKGRERSRIRVMKNLRVCVDCHGWMKYVSMVEGREILLRDSRRFHLFRNGKCSCGDYW